MLKKLVFYPNLGIKWNSNFPEVQGIVTGYPIHIRNTGVAIKMFRENLGDGSSEPEMGH